MKVTLPGVSIRGISCCVPSEEIDNLEFGNELYGPDVESLVRTTGVRKRRVCKEKEITALDLSVQSAKKLLEKMDANPESFGGIIFVTQTPDYLMPNNATYCQYLLDFPQNIAAFDINLACSGYPYGLFVAGSLAKATHKSVLMLDGETNSHYVSPKDKITALLFGDAGSATIITPSVESVSWYFDFETVGAKRDALIIPDGGYRNRINAHSASYKEYPDGGFRRPIDMKMNGQDVFNFVARNVPKRIRSLIQDADIQTSDIDWLVLHQANEFMLKQVARSVKIPWDKVPISIGKYGNSSSPTIPVTICSELNDVIQSNTKSNMLLCGFGAGLSIGAAYLPMQNVVSTGVIEYE